MEKNEPDPQVQPQPPVANRNTEDVAGDPRSGDEREKTSANNRSSTIDAYERSSANNSIGDGLNLFDRAEEEKLRAKMFLAVKRNVALRLLDGDEVNELADQVGCSEAK